MNNKVDIYDELDGEYVARELEFWGITDALVAHFFPDGKVFDQTVYDACVGLGDEWAKGMPTQGYESYLGVTVTSSQEE